MPINKTIATTALVAVVACLGCSRESMPRQGADKPAAALPVALTSNTSADEDAPGDAQSSTSTASACCLTPGDQKIEEAIAASDMNLPDLELLDQDGNKVRFYSDLVKDKVVAINFFFTTCTTICPPLTANFAALQKRMLQRGQNKDFQMISISVDPLTDTPPRLKAWAQMFNAQPGWTLLTGDKQTVDTLLKALKVFTPIKEDHSPIVLIGDEKNRLWTRVYGLGSPEDMVRVVQKTMEQAALDNTAKADATEEDDHSGEHFPEVPASKEGNTAAHNYFSDVQLVNQHGQSMRFYSDLIKDKIVVINCFFAECVGVCPVMNNNLQAIQESLGDRVGRDVHIISITVDPVHDTPQRLLPYAERYQAKPGWYFLTGSKEQVDYALAKLGFAVEQRENHSSVILVGNDKTGLWKKMFGLAKSEELIPIVQQVVNDDGTKTNG